MLTLALAALVALPVVVVLAHVFVPAPEVWRHLAGTVLPDYLRNTLALMLGVGATVLVVGVGTAWLVVMYDFPGRRYFEWALLLPLAVPSYVIAYAYTDFLQFTGPLQSGLRALFEWGRHDYYFPNIRSLGGAITLLAMVLYPYVYLLSRAAFMEQSVCALEVGRTLGRGPWRLFFGVAVPLARPAIAGGVALALMETLNEFGAVQFFGVDTFTTGIFRTWFGLGQPAAAAQLAACLLLFVLLVIGVERWSRGRARYFNTSARYRALPRARMAIGRGVLSALACAAPVVVGFAIPAILLAAQAVEGGQSPFRAELFDYAWNSLLLAGTAAVTAVGLGLLLSYAVRLNHSVWVASTARVASIGYAVPGSVIAVGLLIPLGWADHTINSVAREYFGTQPGLVLTGTMVVLIYAYVVRFLAVSYNALEASLSKVTPNMDAASRTLGKSAARTLRWVHVPMLRSSLLAAGLLVFVDVMKELPATVILRPFNFTTLAVRAHELASDERLAEASVPSLAIVLAGIVPVIMLSMALRHARPGHHGE